jgi:ribonuclease P protein component
MYRRVKAEGSVLRKFPLSMRILHGTTISDSRIGYVIRKRAGKAVMRNALRRILRETFQHTHARFDQPTWVVFEVSDRVAEVTRRVFNQCAAALLESLCRSAA